MQTLHASNKTAGNEKCYLTHLDSFWDLVDILWFNDSFQVILKDLCEVVLQLRATEIRQNF